MNKVPTYILLVDPWQAEHIREIRQVFQGHKVVMYAKKVSSISELLPVIRKVERTGEFEIKGILLSYSAILKQLIGEKFSDPKKLGKGEAISTNYQGALFHRKIGKVEYPVVILPELKSFVYKKTGSFLAETFFSKLHDASFPSAPTMEWETLNETNAEKLYDLFKHAVIIGGDIETQNMEVPYWVRNDPAHKGMWLETYRRTGDDHKKSKTRITAIPKITLSGYTGLFKNEKGIYESYTVVIPITSMENIKWMRKFNALPAPKIFQNGIYDNAYFLRYNAPLTNFLYDTKFLMHAWYAELPRKLEFISAMFLRNHMYWKDESSMDGEYYNAQDCHNMTWACMFLLQKMPQWARDNYIENFPKVFPAISANMQGVLIDEEARKKNLGEAEDRLKKASERLEIITSTQWFNGSSSQQVVKLMLAMGTKSKKSDKAALRAFRDKSDLNEIYVSAIDEVRKQKKAIGNYFELDLFDGRVMTSIDPSGTESGRCAAKESAFWCGLNIQNVPFYAKDQFLPDEGYKFGALDYAQSESRCTAYMSEDLKLIDAVENSIDFHVRNASLFFGIPEETILGYKESDLALFKKIRNAIGKKVNHGANYNMGPKVLLQNMGARAVIDAAKTLGLSPTMSLFSVCAYLLEAFDKAYPLIRDLKNPESYYSKVITEIEETGLLVGPTGWTRKCFGDPRGNKLDLNSYVAHGPQSLSVKKVNESWYTAWLKLEMEEGVVRFLPQIHDELWFMYKEENEDYVFSEIESIMQQPTIVNNREMIIPTDSARGASRWSECK